MEGFDSPEGLKKKHSEDATLSGGDVDTVYGPLYNKNPYKMTKDDTSKTRAIIEGKYGHKVLKFIKKSK